MAQQTVNNGEGGLVVRGKLNGNFTELYDGFGFNTPVNWLPNSTGDGTAARGFIDTAPANHPDEVWASLNVEVIAPGSDKNGPTSADYGGVFSIRKQGYASGSAVSGEIDALTIFVRNDGPDGLPTQDPDSSDAAGILVNAQNVGTCGVILAYEGVTTNLNRSTGLIDFALRTQVGVLDMNGATQGKFGFGVIADAGVITAAFLAQETENGSFANILAAPGALIIGRNGNYLAQNSFWPLGAWAIERSEPENGNTIFTHRGTGGMFFDAPEGQVRFDAAQGMLLPRMTTTQRDAIPTPPDGLQIYNTTTAKMQVRAGGAWVDLH